MSNTRPFSRSALVQLQTKVPRLGVNIDHIATLRQLRGTPYPKILDAARLVEVSGGDQITVHLREDRRHIQDEDVRILRKELKISLNLEMAVSPEIIRIATQVLPHSVCLVPEKRQELTTEGGLDVKKNLRKIAKAVQTLRKAGLHVSCFIEPKLSSVRLCHEIGSDAVEFHTGQFCLATQGGLGKRSQARAHFELNRLKKAATLAVKLGLHAHAGHGFDYENVRPVAALENEDRSPLIEEYNIGHSIVCRAALVGLERAVREMVSAIRAP